MKRLILMGGRPWFAEDGGKKFVDTLFRYYPKEVKLAFCIFAQPENEWEETQSWNTGMFNKFKGEREVEYRTMTEGNFDGISRWADIIYLPGGSTDTLVTRLGGHGDFGKLWDGKLIVGASAGANFMCEGYVYLDRKEYGRGLGWIKATSIPHWRSDYGGYTDGDWDFLEQEAIENAPGTPVLCLPESEFVEFTIS